MEAVRPQITKRRKFIADGVMYSELNEVGLLLQSPLPLSFLLYRDSCI